MQKSSQFKSLPRSQISDDLLWEACRDNHCFLRRTQNVTFSCDPTNLSGLNLKRDSGILSREGLGVTINVAKRTTRRKKNVQTKRSVMRFNLNVKTSRNLGSKRLVVVKKRPTLNSRVFSSAVGVTARQAAKVVKRGLKNYRPDLQSLALRKLAKLDKSRKKHKQLNRRDERAAQKKA